jgi:hypothetical protein
MVITNFYPVKKGFQVREAKRSRSDLLSRVSGPKEAVRVATKGTQN